MKYSGYDIIGDIHGCGNSLETLLQKLDYQNDGDHYYHPERQAIFLGDLVDRGPRIRKTLHLVKSMVDNGAAQCILGNHEYNALGYTTPTPDTENSDSVKYVRAHNARHNRIISETLMQFASYPEEWREYLEWFRTLPLYLDFDSFRVVHACWDQALIDQFDALGAKMYWDKGFIQRSADRKSLEGRVMNRLTRGTDLALPEGLRMKGKDGFVRRMFRTKFWSESPKSFGDVVFQPDPLPEEVAQRQLGEDELSSLIFYGENEKPVFVGHYWLRGSPKPLRDNVACLDYSAVKSGRLVAYRYDEEEALDASKFVWVDVQSEYEEQK